MHVPIIFLSILANIIVCRDFYVGMFKRNDILVAQDRLYKERVFHSRVVAKYGRVFKCPITYFRIVDRLGIGKGPTVEILRGGLQKNFVVLRLRSLYNYPISVNIYVGCENKMRQKPSSSSKVVTTRVSEVTAKSEDATSATTAGAFTNATDVSKDDTNVSDVTTISSKVVTTTVSEVTAKSEDATSATTAGAVTNATDIDVSKDDKTVSNVTTIISTIAEDNSTSGNKTK